MTGCPSDDTIAAFAAAQLSRDQRAAVQTHLEGCDSCHHLVRELARMDALEPPSTRPSTETTAWPAASPTGWSDAGAGDDGAADLRAGDRLDGYVLLRPLDAGAMGQVWLAEDATLQRQVAIKVLHGSRVRRSAGVLQREAQLLAQLSHPNVVTVHAVAHAGGRDYIAMEYVAGVTLREWLAAGRASLGQRVDVMIQAGRGLAAAHAAGIVHRDFKPSNVLLGADGRARVGDFGLARLRHPGGNGEAPADVAVRTSMAGTPAYMAPEQLRGGAATEAGDQYSFAATLYEAVYGVRPFHAATPDELAASIERDPPRLPQRATRVPSWLRAIVERGLRADAGERFASVAALVDAIDAGRRRGRRRWIAVAMVGVAAATAGVAIPVTHRAAATPRCDGEGVQVAAVWSAARAAEIERQLEAIGGHFGVEQWRRAAPLLDAYATRWSAMRRDTCEATRVRHVQSDSLFDRRMYCLDRRLDQLDSAAASLARLDSRTLVGRVVEIASGLPALDDCARTQWLSDSPMPPVALRGAIDDAFQALDAVRDLSQQGRSRDALVAVRGLAPPAALLAYAPLSAEVAFETAVAAEDAGDVALAETEYERASGLAAELHRVDRVFAAQARLSRMDALHQHIDRALGRASSLASLARLSPDAEHQAAYHENLGAIYTAQGRYADAATAYREAHAALPAEAAGGTRESSIRDGLGMSLKNLGDYAAAEVELARALALRERRYGPRHPVIARALSHVGNVALYRGHYAQALDLFLRALAIRASLVDGPDPDVAVTLGNVAVAEVALGAFAAALVSYDRALALRIQTMGAEHPEVALAMANKGSLLARVGRHDEADALITAAIAMRRKVLSPQHPAVARALSNLGVARVRKAAGSTGAAARAASAAAIGPLTEAIELGTRVLAADHPYVGEALHYRGRALLGVGRVAEARSDAERALAIIRKAFAADSGEVLETTWGLADALLASGDAAQAERLLASTVKEPLRDLTAARAGFALARAWWQSGRRDDAGALAARAIEAFDAAPEAEARADAGAARAWSRQRGAR